MANKLTDAQIAALLPRTVSTLKPGDIDDLKDALDRRHVTSAGGAGSDPDYDRSNESYLNFLLPTTTSSSTTTTTTSTTTTTTTSTTTHTTTTTVSDRRLKHSIRLLGQAFGLDVYSFSYVGSTTKQIGFMAQDVFSKYPAAVHVGSDPAVDPWTINYAKLFMLVGAAQVLQFVALASSHRGVPVAA